MKSSEDGGNGRCGFSAEEVEVPVDGVEYRQSLKNETGIVSYLIFHSHCSQTWSLRELTSWYHHSGFICSVPRWRLRSTINFILVLCLRKIDIDKFLATSGNNFARKLSISISSCRC